MNFRTTIIVTCLLAAVLVVVALTEWLGNEPKTPTARTKGEQGRRLVGLEKDRVTKVLLRAGDAEMQLEKSADKWRIVRPIDWPAESWQVSDLLEALTGLTSRGSMDLKGQALDTSGLKRPRYVYELTAKDGKTARIAIGEKSALGDLYVQIDKEKSAHLVSSSSLADKFDKPAAELMASLRDKSIFNTTSDQIRQVEIVRKGAPRLVLHKPGADWELVEPQKMPLESTEVSDLLSTVINLRADEFIAAGSAQEAAAKFDAPAVTVRFSTQAPSTQPSATAPSVVGTTVLFGQFENLLREKIYAKVSDPNVVIKASVSSTTLDKYLKAKPMELRDRKAANIDPASVSRITLVADLKATTQPTTRPASRKETVISRKKESLVLGPTLPPTPTTGPTTAPTQAAATQPATQPAAPSSPWAIKAGGDADASKVDALLNELHPLKVDKYLEAAATATQPSANYILTIETESAGGAKSTRHEFRFVVPAGTDKKPVGTYNGLTFELGASFIEKLDAEWKAK